MHYWSLDRTSNGKFCSSLWLCLFTEVNCIQFVGLYTIRLLLQWTKFILRFTTDNLVHDELCSWLRLHQICVGEITIRQGLLAARNIYNMALLWKFLAGEIWFALHVCPIFLPNICHATGSEAWYRRVPSWKVKWAHTKLSWTFALHTSWVQYFFFLSHSYIIYDVYI